MAIKALALILFLFSLPITLTVEGRCLVIAGLLGSFGASLIALQGGSFWVICSRFLLSFLGFGTVCLVRVDPYAVMFFAFFTLGIIDWTCRDGLSGSGASQIRDFRTGGVAQDDSNVLRAGISSGWYFGGVLAIAMFWFFLHVVFAATTTIWSLKTWHLILVHQSPAIFPVYGQIASLALLCGYMTLFSSSASARSFFLKGVHVGLWCAMPLVFLQLSGITLPYVSGEAPFWQQYSVALDCYLHNQTSLLALKCIKLMPINKLKQFSGVLRESILQESLIKLDEYLIDESLVVKLIKL